MSNPTKEFVDMSQSERGAKLYELIVLKGFDHPDCKKLIEDWVYYSCGKMVQL